MNERQRLREKEQLALDLMEQTERAMRAEAEVERLREQLRIAEDVLGKIAQCGCSACGPAPRDLAHARMLADDALTCMSVVE